MKIFIRIIFVALLFNSGVLHAQFIQDNKRIADTYFNNNEYYAASQYYLKALNNTSIDSTSVLPYPLQRNNRKSAKDAAETDDTEYIMFKLAESYRLYNNHFEAEKAYKAVLTSANPDYRLAPFWYAKSLRANKKYAEAISAFESFLSNYNVNDEYKKAASDEILSSRFALQEMKYPRLVSVQKLSGDINTAGSNYAPFKLDNLLYFTSSRPSGKSVKKRALYTENSLRLTQKDDPFLNAVYSVDNTGQTVSGNASKLSLPAGASEFAAATFSADGKSVYYTAWSESKTGKEYKLYHSTLAESGKWSDGVLLGDQVNVAGYNTKQPSLSSDGKYLVFSSNRPGGSGKYDLWYSPLSADGSLGQAANMGPQINTAQDEEAPYYHTSTGKLIFSSNGRIGLGGFDFYESQGNFGSWSAPVNMGYPYNSSKDDMYFSPSNESGTEGFISSDRESECCLEMFSVKVGKLAIQGILTDCDRGLALKGAKVIMTDSLSNTSQQVFTDDNGRFRFEIGSRRPFKLSAEKDDYFTKVIDYSTKDFVMADTLFSPAICLTAYKVDVPIVLKEVFYDFNSAELTEPSKSVLDNLHKIMVDNPTITIELSAHTDSIGSDEYNMNLSQRRAQSCVDYLVGKNISVSRLNAKGYGETRPVAPNSTPDGKDNPGGRQLNRRTEFKVLND